MISIPIRFLPIRILFLLALVAVLAVLGSLIVRGGIGDSVMTYVQRAPNLPVETQVEGADLALRYAPRDPSIRWRRGGVYLNAANEEQQESRLDVALEELRQAANLSPEDYRVWLSLGRALDRYGSTSEARQALDRAVELAPNHFDPRWARGNHLLRAGDRDASFAEMRLALANRPSALPLVFDYAWSAFNGDGKALAAALALDGAGAAEIKPKLIVLLIARGRVEDALAVWRGIASPTADDVRGVTEALVNAGRYRAAFDVWSNANLADRPVPDAGSLLANGGFEQMPSSAPFFNWRLLTGALAKLTLDRKGPREGKQALRAGFNVRDNVAFTIASQLVPVKASTAYRLSFWVKIEEMESLSAPIVELYDPALEVGAAGRARAATPPLPNKDHEWKEYQLDVTTNAATEALKVRVQRLPCSEAPCPINGRIWLDEFRLVERSPAH